jgi:uncharacterized protein YyaL (SSP411 family)
MLIALDWFLGPTYEIAILGDPSQAGMQRATDELRRRYIPNKLVGMRKQGAPAENQSRALDALFANKNAPAQPTVYICQNYACQAPIAGIDEVLAAWDRLAP